MLVDSKGNAGRLIILAHGAGAPMDSAFMNDVAAVKRYGIGMVFANAT